MAFFSRDFQIPTHTGKIARTRKVNLNIERVESVHFLNSAVSPFSVKIRTTQYKVQHLEII